MQIIRGQDGLAARLFGAFDEILFAVLASPDGEFAETAEKFLGVHFAVIDEVFSGLGGGKYRSFGGVVERWDVVA